MFLYLYGGYSPQTPRVFRYRLLFFSNKRQFSCLSPRFLVILHTTSEDTFSGTYHAEVGGMSNRSNLFLFGWGYGLSAIPCCSPHCMLCCFSKWRISAGAGVAAWRLLLSSSYQGAWRRFSRMRLSGVCCDAGTARQAYRG